MPTVDNAQTRIAGVVKVLLAGTSETQACLATALGYGQSTLSEMLRGKRRMTVDDLDRIAGHFHQPVSVFFEGSAPLGLDTGLDGPVQASGWATAAELTEMASASEKRTEAVSAARKRHPSTKRTSARGRPRSRRAA